MEANLEKSLKDFIKNMPSLPTSVTKVMEICNNPQTSPADLNQVISLDPVLMGRVLKLINSAYYGLGQQVKSLARAIIMLGMNTVKNLALSSAV
ncbi:MAG: HDOD domain-containing protein, partial [Treponema sp.]|nr:HDOD domain-containing protein [Treponema sp.]